MSHEQNDITAKGINKLFDVMRADLGDQQTSEISQFYEKMKN